MTDIVGCRSVAVTEVQTLRWLIWRARSNDLSGTFQQQQQYYYTTHTSGGYINLSTQKVSYDESAGSRSQQSQSQTTLFENQRHSPLNLERNRSSPLNLTSGMPHSHVNNCSQNNRTYFPEMPNGNFHHPDHQSNNCNFNPNDASFDMFQTDNSQQQQQQQPGQVETFFQQSTHHPIMTNDQQQTLIGSQPPSQYPYQPCSQHPVPLANTDRTRIFCSHCCLEVSSPLELSKHNMERHGVQEPQAFHKTPSNPAWNAIPTNYQTESSIQQDPSNVQIMSNNPTNYNEQQASSDNTAVVSKSQSVEQTSLPASSLPDNLNSQCSKKEDPPIHNCQSCAMSFKSGPDLKKHLDLVHSGRQSGAALLCRICDKPFEQKSELKSHMEWHAKERPFRCDICDARLANQAGLNRHIKRMHDKVQPYSCKECGKGYYEKHDLVRHMKAHERASQVPNCDICGKVFSTFYQREKHKCKGPEGKFPCEICDSKMDSKESWGFHMWRHTKDPKYIEIGPINKSSSSSSEETKEKS